MSTTSSRYWIDQYTDRDWSGMKWFFILGWNALLLFIYSSLVNTTDVKGICSWFDCNVLQTSMARIILGIGLVIFTVAYLRERWMLITTIGLATISVIVFSAGESNGIAARCEMLSAILIAQVIAYAKYKFTNDEVALKQDRIRYSVQIVVAAYLLAALSKVLSSDLDWVNNSGPLAINAKVAILRFKADLGIQGLEAYAQFIHDLFLKWPKFVKFILATSLLIESVAFVSLLGRKWTQYYGFLLVFFHACIFLSMFVFVPPVLLCVFVFMINGPAIIIIAYQAVKARILEKTNVGRS